MLCPHFFQILISCWVFNAKILHKIMKNCKVKQIWNEMLKTREMLCFLFILMQALKNKLQVETYDVFFSFSYGKFLSYNPFCLSWNKFHENSVNLKYFLVTFCWCCGNETNSFDWFKTTNSLKLIKYFSDLFPRL